MLRISHFIPISRITKFLSYAKNDLLSISNAGEEIMDRILQQEEKFKKK